MKILHHCNMENLHTILDKYKPLETMSNNFAEGWGRWPIKYIMTVRFLIFLFDSFFFLMWGKVFSRNFLFMPLFPGNSLFLGNS